MTRAANVDSLVNLSFQKAGNVNVPITTTLSVETEDETLRVDVNLTEHQLVHLLSGTVVRVNARVVRKDEA